MKVDEVRGIGKTPIRVSLREAQIRVREA